MSAKQLLICDACGCETAADNPATPFIRVETTCEVGIDPTEEIARRVGRIHLCRACTIHRLPLVPRKRDRQ